MVHRVTRCAIWLFWLSALLPGLSATPESRIAFQRNDPPAVTVMFNDGSSAVDLPANRLFRDPYITPSLAPDGHTIAFAAMTGKTYKVFLWRLDEHNNVIGDPKRLTTENADTTERFPSWSPDGKKIALLLTDKAKVTTLRVADADGSDMVSLTTVNYLATPMWSPDSRQLLYINQLVDKSGLFNIFAAGGKGLPFRPESRILAACYSPDGQQIAALIQQENGLSSLYTLPPFGVGGRVILKNISGGKSINWLHSDTIVFNAVKVDRQSGKAFWMVHPDGSGLRGVTGYADPKQISFFSEQKCDLTPYVPVAIAPDTVQIPTLNNPIDQANGTRQELSDIMAAHTVVILSPTAGSTVTGMTPIEIVARKKVAKITILIGGEFVSTASTVGAGPVAKLSYLWNTQELREVNPAMGLPASYDESLRYPDGTYTICAQALDAGNQVVDSHLVTVTVNNSVPVSALPNKTIVAQYQFNAKNPDLWYRVHGEGIMLGDGAPTDLNATLDVAIHQKMVKILGDGQYGFYTNMRGPKNRSALLFGQYHANLPEFAADGKFILTTQGDLIPDPAGTSYLPLTQLATPLPGSPELHLGQEWAKPMWVVADLFTREATYVKARHICEGLELVDGQRTARIRSEFTLTPTAINLRTMPLQAVPGLRKLTGENTTAPQETPTGPVSSLTVQQVTGVRYSWIDLDNKRLTQVEDTFLYSFAGPANWYLVHYLYSEMPDPTKK